MFPVSLYLADFDNLYIILNPFVNVVDLFWLWTVYSFHTYYMF